jgi:hypothetical protein
VPRPRVARAQWKVDEAVLGPDQFGAAAVGSEVAVSAHLDLADQRPVVTVEARPSRLLGERHREGWTFLVADSLLGSPR